MLPPAETPGLVFERKGGPVFLGCVWWLMVGISMLKPCPYIVCIIMTSYLKVSGYEGPRGQKLENTSGIPLGQLEARPPFLNSILAPFLRKMAWTDSGL